MERSCADCEARLTEEATACSGYGQAVVSPQGSEQGRQDCEICEPQPPDAGPNDTEQPDVPEDRGAAGAQNPGRERLARTGYVAGGILGMAMILLIGVIIPIAALLLPASGTEPARLLVPEPDTAREPAATYSAVEPFRPVLSYTVGEGWPYRYGLATELYQISQVDNSTLSFLDVREVHDPAEPNLENASPAPESVEGMVGWVRDHPYLLTSEPEPVTVGGAGGVAFDVAISSVPEDYPPSRGCESLCVPLFRHSDGSSFWIYDQTPQEIGIRHRVLVLDAGGETVTVVIEGPIDRFGEFLAEAEEVLGSVKWGGLPAAEYITEQFRPPLSFETVEGWPYRYGIESDFYQISRVDGSTLGFLVPREVYDPADPIWTAPAPEDISAWFREHPLLDVGEPEPTTIGGASGVAFDVTVPAIPEDYPAEDCETPCVRLFSQSDASPFVFFEGNKNRVAVLDVEGETVVITMETSEDRFGEFLSEAERVLETVKWGG